ncbi:MAG: hypothetical protein UU89_C0022G0001 [Parcubacteria group bacterium GW2011_GWC2_42_11]|nr:MAG: hypothetical protein UU89_C0022G0001 [Parcubacteria group bacterium GW2011_GWC2_42_11]
MANIIGHVDLYELRRRLDASRPAHKGALDDICNIIQEGKKKRLAAAPAHTCNVGSALKKALLKKSIKG